MFDRQIKERIGLKMSILSEEELIIIKERCNKTTKAPWVSYVEGRDHGCGSNFIMTGDEDIELIGATIEDQDFIAHARQDIPKLLQEIKRLKQQLLALK